jgi:hypothetical protein
MTEPCEYVLEPLREVAEFALYRAWQHGNSSPVLVVALAAEQPSPEDLRQLDYTGLSMEDWRGRGWRAVAHPGDLVRTVEKSGMGDSENRMKCEVRTRTAPASR